MGSDDVTVSLRHGDPETGLIDGLGPHDTSHDMYLPRREETERERQRERQRETERETERDRVCVCYVPHSS